MRGLATLELEQPAAAARRREHLGALGGEGGGVWACMGKGVAVWGRDA